MEDTIVKQGRWLEIFLSSFNNFYLNIMQGFWYYNKHTHQDIIPDSNEINFTLS